MKKILLIFLFSIFIFVENVNAEDVFEVTYNIKMEEYINEDFYKLQNLAKKHASDNGLYYFIYNNNLYFTTSSELTSTGRTWFEFSYEGYSATYDLDTGVVTPSSEIKTLNFVEASHYLYRLLDSSVTFYYSPYQLLINYNELSYNVDATNKVPTLYEIYNEENNIIPTNPHEEELGFLSNFYSLAINKIVEFATYISSNYISLAIVVVLVFVFIFRLILRR